MTEPRAVAAVNAAAKRFKELTERREALQRELEQERASRATSAYEQWTGAPHGEDPPDDAFVSKREQMLERKLASISVAIDEAGARLHQARIGAQTDAIARADRSIAKLDNEAANIVREWSDAQAQLVDLDQRLDRCHRERERIAAIAQRTVAEQIEQPPLLQELSRAGQAVAKAQGIVEKARSDMALFDTIRRVVPGIPGELKCDVVRALTEAAKTDNDNDAPVILGALDEAPFELASKRGQIVDIAARRYEGAMERMARARRDLQRAVAREREVKADLNDSRKSSVRVQPTANPTWDKVPPGQLGLGAGRVTDPTLQLATRPYIGATNLRQSIIGRHLVDQALALAARVLGRPIVDEAKHRRSEARPQPATVE